MFAAAGAALLSLAQPAALSAAHAAAPASTGSDAPAPRGNVPPGVHTVTLITGDIVITRQSGATGGTVELRGADGAKARAHIMESRGDLYVYPESALPYVAAGTLDRRLFNISKLVADGYDDAHRDHLPLIVSYDSASAGLRSTTPRGATRVRDLSSVQGAALTEDRDLSADFWRSVTSVSASGAGARAAKAGAGTAPSFGSGIARIWLDGKVEADLADTTAQIGAPQAWSAGDTGKGVDVAVLDTGVDTGHPDLSGRITAARSFVPDQDVTDRNGHGTHVASTIAGTGAASDGKEKGVAPGADLHVGKVLADTGSGQDSWVLAGMEWAAVDQDADIVSMSLGSENPSDGTDPLSAAVDRLSAQTGALFVIAAGNMGTPGSIGGPGAADAALTVGAVDSSDDMAWFSSQGPRVGDGGLKPEITAPGVDVLAARSQYAPEGEGSYQTLSGTSMATPHVAGAAALLAAARPGLTGAQLKDLLVSSSKRTPQYDAFQAGSGRVDVPSALGAGVFASATAFTGQAEAGGGTAAVRRPVTYTNTGDSAVTLALSVEAPNAPAGLFALSASRVVVPAHGTAEVTVAIDGSKVTGNGRWSGQVVAADTAGKAVTHTAVSLGDAAHKLTMVLKDGDGKPMSGVVEVLRSGDFDPAFYLVDQTGRLETWIPDDVYSVLSFKDVRGVHGAHSMGMALLGDPEVVMDRDRTVTLDATKLQRVDMTTPQPTEATYQRLEYNRAMGGGTWRDYMETQTSYDSLWAQPTTHKVTHGDFHLGARWRKEQPALSVTTGDDEFTDVLRQEDVTALPQGHYSFPLVAAGEGASADYAGLSARGKAVVVRRNGNVGDAEQAAAAVAAGARLLLVVNDQPGRQLRSYTGDPFLPPAAVDVALLSTDEGERLMRRASARGAVLKVGSQPVSPYVYDLMWTWHNEIPGRLVVKGGTKNLARVDVTFDSPDPAKGGGEFRFDWPVYSNWGLGLTMREPVNSRRVDWVSTGPGYSWGQEAYVDGLMYEIEPRTTYRAGSRHTQQWFKPVERPFLNNNYKLPTRSGSWLAFDIPAWGGADHVGMSMDYDRTQQTLTLYQGGTRLGQSTTNTSMGGTAPAAGKLPYRLVLDASRDASVSPYSSATHTEWEFTSKAPSGDDAAVLPLPQIDYRVATDEEGRAARNDTLSVTAAHLPGAVGAGTLSAVSLEVSYDDGRTWRKTACGHDGRFKLSAPKQARFVSLRARAHDSAGNAVTQTVNRAFGLR
ncbi:S8 family serine peptidase [Actinacidiphila glaucinigra]|uniref:S8 family serine peptidase n=1 Tax=Actinacidiphila glaucinigra TaxID=235986 RepID=UPI002DDC650D|nr:S8 family serine peptidase [Actinacidiphila glaucinigra]WSD58442.1 S8 family serine peptidase [Actinacidiphila glaucinigra]